MSRSFKKQYLKLDQQFVSKVMLLSLPMAMLFILLSLTNLLSPGASILCYAFTLICNAFLLLPINAEINALQNYIYNLSRGKTSSNNLSLSLQGTQKLAEAIQSIHRIWTAKAGTLEAQALADAAVFDTIPDPIIILDAEGTITTCNLPAKKFLGDDIISRNIDTLFSTNIFIAAVDKVLKGKSDSENITFHAPEYNNSQIYTHITRLPKQIKGRAAAAISMYDISKSLSLEKMQADFVANASHELRTPLSVISGFIDTLQTSAHDDADARDAFLEIMKEQTEYMSALVEDLLSLSRLEMGQDKELKDKVDIREVIDDTVNTLKMKAFNRSIDIKINEKSHISKVRGDTQQIRQLLQNLLDNAIKYAPENSQVTIEYKSVPRIPAKSGQNISSGKAICVSFNNKGQRINKENMARLTERFYRMQVHKDMKIRGTGLGLSIAKQIVLHHRGNLTVTSTTSEGNTFTVYLPLKQ